jgi:Methyltransferase domain
MKRVLNVGGNSKSIPLPPQYAGFDHWLLDIDPTGKPDIVCDSREMSQLDADIFDAVYCSHNLEHYHYHDVQSVLKGFLHVLKSGGFAHIRVPDMEAVMRTVVNNGLDIEDVLYQSPAGPISVLDVIYGYGRQIETSGQGFYAHKTGFTSKSLEKALIKAGFVQVFLALSDLEISVVAFKDQVSQPGIDLFGLSSIHNASNQFN